MNIINNQYLLFIDKLLNIHFLDNYCFCLNYNLLMMSININKYIGIKNQT